MKKALKIVVLAKQVPDTRNVGKDAMTPRRDGQPRGAAGHLQSGGPQCARNGARAERPHRRLHGSYPYDGSAARRRHYPRRHVPRGRRRLSAFGPRVRRFGHPRHVVRAVLRAENDRSRHHLRGPSGHRRRYGAGRTSGGREAGPAAGDLCRGDYRNQSGFAGHQTPPELRHGDGRDARSGGRYGQRVGSRMPSAQRQARDDLQIRPRQIGDRRSSRLAGRQARRRKASTCRSSSGPPPTSIPIRSSWALRVRPPRSRRSRTWCFGPRRPRNSRLPTRISIH